MIHELVKIFIEVVDIYYFDSYVLQVTLPVSKCYNTNSQRCALHVIKNLAEIVKGLYVDILDVVSPCIFLCVC